MGKKKKRREEYRGRRRKRRGGGFLLSLLTMLLVIGAIIASVTVFLKVAKIEVTGLTHYTPQQIIETSGIRTGDNMFAVNKFDVAQRILDEYPYVGEIKISRRLPDTFVFEITERVPAGFFQTDKFRWLIDRDGYLIESIPADQQVALPAIAGATMLAPVAGDRVTIKEEGSLQAMSEILAALEKNDVVRKIGKVDVSKLYNLSITYENRFVVILGDSTELEKKIKMLKAVVEELGPSEKGTINISDVKQARFQPNANVKL